MLISGEELSCTLTTKISGDGRRQRRAIEHFICNACFYFTLEIGSLMDLAVQIMKLHCCRVPDCKVLKHKRKPPGNLLAGGRKPGTWVLGRGSRKELYLQAG